MKFLTVVASRHGATRGIAQALSDELTTDGHVVTVSSTSEAPPVEDYDGVGRRQGGLFRQMAQ
jgi:flavodoxin